MATIEKDDPGLGWWENEGGFVGREPLQGPETPAAAADPANTATSESLLGHVAVTPQETPPPPEQAV